MQTLREARNIFVYRRVMKADAITSCTGTRRAAARSRRGSRQSVFAAVRDASVTRSVGARADRTDVLVHPASGYALPLAGSADKRPGARFTRLVDERPDKGVAIRVRPQALAVTGRLSLYNKDIAAQWFVAFAQGLNALSDV